MGRPPKCSLTVGRTAMRGRSSRGSAESPPADLIDQLRNDCENPLVIRHKFGALAYSKVRTRTLRRAQATTR
jgi:hypothetical protein